MARMHTCLQPENYPTFVFSLISHNSDLPITLSEELLSTSTTTTSPIMDMGGMNMSMGGMSGMGGMGMDSGHGHSHSHMGSGHGADSAPACRSKHLPFKPDCPRLPHTDHVLSFS